MLEMKLTRRTCAAAYAGSRSCGSYACSCHHCAA